MEFEEYFKGATLSGNEELDIVLELLENAWKDEIERLSGSAAKASDLKNCQKKYADVKAIRSNIVASTPVPRAQYKLAALIDCIAASNPPHLSKCKNIDVELTLAGAKVTFSATSWSRMHGELYRAINKASPSSFQFLFQTHGKSLKLHSSNQGLIRPFEIAPGHYLETNLSTLDTLKKIKQLPAILGIKPKDFIITA